MHNLDRPLVGLEIDISLGGFLSRRGYYVYVYQGGGSYNESDVLCRVA